MSPAMFSSRGCTQPVQALPAGCAETRTKSWELEPAQTQPGPAARWASHRDGMWSTPTSSRGAIGARQAAVVSSKKSSCPVMAMAGVWKAARARAFGQPVIDLRPKAYLFKLGRSSRSGSMIRIAAVTAGIRSRAYRAALVIAPPLITSMAPSRIGPSAP